jgi:hypothetical protein
MPLVILHHLLNVSVQLANKRELKKNYTAKLMEAICNVYTKNSYIIIKCYHKECRTLLVTWPHVVLTKEIY